MALTPHNIPSCCGAIIFTGFQGSHTVGDYGPTLTDDEIKAWLDKNEDFQRKQMNMAMAIVTLNDAQMAKKGYLFKDRGYVFSPPMWHNKHRTRLFLGYKPLQEDPGAEAFPFHDGETSPKSYGQPVTNTELKMRLAALKAEKLKNLVVA